MEPHRTGRGPGHIRRFKHTFLYVNICCGAGSWIGVPCQFAIKAGPEDFLMFQGQCATAGPTPSGEQFGRARHNPGWQMAVMTSHTALVRGRYYTENVQFW